MKLRKGSIGLDLSLRSSAACFIAEGWKGDMREGKGIVVGGPWGREAMEADSASGVEEDKAERMSEIAEAIRVFVARFDHGGEIAIEGHAFGLAHRANGSLLMELAGAVKVHLFRELNVVCIPVAAPSARKTLLDNCPVKGAKEFVERNVRRLKGEALYWQGDQVDSFVVCNHFVRLRGGVPLSFAGE